MSKFGGKVNGGLACVVLLGEGVLQALRWEMVPLPAVVRRCVRWMLVWARTAIPMRLND